MDMVPLLGFLALVLVVVTVVALVLRATTKATTIASVAVTQHQPFHLTVDIPSSGATLRLHQRYTGQRSSAGPSAVYQAAIELTVASGAATERHCVSVGTMEAMSGAVERSGLTTIHSRVVVGDDGRGNRTAESTELLQVRLAPGRVRIDGTLHVTQGRFEEGSLLAVV